jgi:hypothetical protein
MDMNVTTIPATFAVIAVGFAVNLSTAQPVQDGKGAPAGGRALSAAQLVALKRVQEHLQKVKIPRPHVAVITDDAVNQAFPNDHFVAVRFPVWPQAAALPEPFKSANLFVVSQDGKIQHLTDAKGLEKVFKARLKPATRFKDNNRALAAWLWLTTEFIQDGFFKFALGGERKARKPEGKDLLGPTSEIWGSIQVVPEMGNKGQIKAGLFFDKVGRLIKVTEENYVLPGVRPRCQATRLLDPDPVIRAICEQDLLVIGVAAREYLTEQRAKASPELGRAIDRVWQRILQEGR